MIAPTLKALAKGRQIAMHCYDFAANQKIPKYILHVIDSNDDSHLEKRSCAAFITP